MFGNIGTPEIILIVLVILILFGANKIPDFARGLGKGLKEFKKAIKEVEEEVNKDEETKSEKSEEEKK